MKRAAGFIIFRRKSERVEYLLLQASYGKHHWTPPKGHVEYGENDMATAYRETEEEAGFHKEHLKVFPRFLAVLHYYVKMSPKEAVYWLAELVDDDRKVKLSNEHKKFEWCDLEKACEYVNHEELKKTLRNSQIFIDTLIS